MRKKTVLIADQIGPRKKEKIVGNNVISATDVVRNSAAKVVLRS